MLPYHNKKTAPSRMARKRSRQDVFIKNKKATRLRRKAARLLRKQQDVVEGV